MVDTSTTHPVPQANSACIPVVAVETVAADATVDATAQTVQRTRTRHLSITDIPFLKDATAPLKTVSIQARRSHPVAM